jgi:hypothetical protein
MHEMSKLILGRTSNKHSLVGFYNVNVCIMCIRYNYKQMRSKHKLVANECFVTKYKRNIRQFREQFEVNSSLC